MSTRPRLRIPSALVVAIAATSVTACTYVDPAPSCEPVQLVGHPDASACSNGYCITYYEANGTRFYERCGSQYTAYLPDGAVADSFVIPG